MKNKAAIYTPVLLIVVYLFLAAVRFIPTQTLGLEETPYFSVVILQMLIYVVPVLFYCKIKSRAFVGRMRIRLPRLSHVLLLVYASVLLICGNALISMGMYYWMPVKFADTSVVGQASLMVGSGTFDAVYMAVAFAVIPAVTEELLFRGIVVGEYESYGPVIAVVISSAVFAMSHFSFARMPVYLFSGVVLALVLYATRSLFASAVIHSLNNLSVLFLEKYIVHIVDKQNISMLLLLIILAALTVIALLLFCGEASGIYRGYAEEMLTVDYGAERGSSVVARIASVCFSPTFLVLVVLFITFTVTG